MSDIASVVSLQSRIETAIAELGPSVEDGVIKLRAEEIAKKRIELISLAMNVRDKLKAEAKKQRKPDIPPSYSMDGVTIAVPPSMSAGRVKLLRRIDENLTRLEVMLNGALSSHATNDTAKITDAYEKLTKAADDISKVKFDDPKSDAADNS